MADLIFYRVKLKEIIGTTVLIGWVRLVPASSPEEAARRAHHFRQKKTPGTFPEVLDVQFVHPGPLPSELLADQGLT